jgi:hypothetical protein
MNTNTEISITLSDKQKNELDKWRAHIKALYGEYGSFTWKITPTGIGHEISVYSHHARVELDLTDVDSW